MLTPEQLTNVELGFLCGAVCGPVLYYVGAMLLILVGERRARRRASRW